MAAIWHDSVSIPIVHPHYAPTSNTFRHDNHKTYMLFVGWEVRIVKNCDRGQSFSNIQTNPKPVNNLFFSKLSNEKKTHRKQTHASVTVTVVRDRKIRTTLRTNQIAGFVTVPTWKKINSVSGFPLLCHIVMELFTCSPSSTIMQC